MRTLNRAKKVITIMLALALVFALSPHLPGMEGEALAASASTLYITDSVGGESRTVTESSSGKGWDWDAATATLTLSSFDGSYIEADGDIKIILDGTNRITPANDAQYVIKADGVITIEKTSNDETDKLIIENNAMTSSSFRAIYGRSSVEYKDTIVNGGTVEIKIKNENSSTIYGGYYIYLYGSSNLKIDIDGYNVIGATGIYVNDSADVNVSVNAQTYATGTDHFSALGSGNVTMTATINGDYTHANAEAFDLDAGYEFKGMKLKPGGKVTAKGRISQWRDYNVQAIDDTVKTTPAARILKKESSTSYYLIYHDASGNPITEMTFEGTDTLQPMSFNNPGGLFNIPESEVGTRIDTIYLMSGLSSRNATFSLKAGSSLPDEITLSSSGRISGTPTAPAAAGTVTIVATRADTEPIEFEISYGEVKVKQPVTGVTLSQTELILNRNDSETLTAAVLPEDASIRTVSWNSSHSDIARVNSTYSGSETATVKGLSVGEATITVTTTQGNKQATCTVYVRENKPNAAVDYVNERLTGLISGAKYEISGSGITTYSFTATETYCEIDENWFGKNISIVRVNDTEINCNSEAQTIDIPGRPAAPTLTTQEESYEGAGDGKISGVDTTMQYRKTGETNWISCTGSELTNLATGSYEVRVKAIAGTQFAGKTTKVTIGTKAFTFEKPTDIPTGNTTTWIDSLNLSSYVSGGKIPYTYTIVSGPAWITLKGSTISGQRPASPTAAGGQEKDLVLKVSDANSQELTQTIKVGDVTQKPQDAPDKPVQSGEAGTNSITIQTISGQLYACVPATEENAPNPGEAAWITPDGSGTHTFTGLTHNTEYKIYAMKPAQGEYSASAASDPLIVTTKEAFTKTPVPSKASGGFKNPFTLTATSEEGTTIYYTTDGTEPSNGYTKDKFPESGITIGNSSDPVGTIYTVKLKAFMDDGSKSPSETITLTYTKVDGYTVSGTAVSWNNTDNAKYLLYASTTSDEDIKADIKLGSPEKALSYAVTKGGITQNSDGKRYDQTFSVVGVPTGTYKLAISKPGKYVPKIITITVDSSDKDLGELKLWLYGDVDYNGTVNSTDILHTKLKIATKPSIFDEGDEAKKQERFEAANVTMIVNTDPNLSAQDILQLKLKIATKPSVFDAID